MAQDNALDEVVVVGYNTTTKERFTGTATTIKTENIEAKTQGNVSQALRGEVAGVNVISYSGAQVLMQQSESVVLDLLMEIRSSNYS